MAEPTAGGLIDTSYLVRYLTGDPLRSAERARRVIEGSSAVLLSELVLLETAHVLRTLYGVPREALIDSLLAFLRRENVRTLDRSKDLLSEALALCRPSGRTSIADALIWAQVASAGVPIYTFDRRFPAPGIELRHG
jgi:predicted nucleic acid-binding protein